MSLWKNGAGVTPGKFTQMFFETILGLLLLLARTAHIHPVAFQKNKGQAPADVRYLLHGPDISSTSNVAKSCSLQVRIAAN